MPTPRRLSFEDLMLGAIALLTVGAFFLIAGSIGSDLGARRASDAYYNRLVAGFQVGQLHAKIEVPAGLAALADPFDPAVNRGYRLAPLWEHGMLHDLSYHGGKFHLYFGVTPALILFWPFHLLTGGWISHQLAAATFASLGFLFSLLLLRLVRRRHFQAASSFTLALGALSLGLGSGIPLTLNRPDVWEVPILCGYSLVMLALLLLWLALERPARRIQFLALASLVFGLALGARPSLLLGAVILVLPILRERRAPLHQLFPLTLAALIPITVIGLSLLAYNHLRFGNPLEFGQRFQLAGVRISSLQLFSTGYLPFNLHAYFLHVPDWPGALPAWSFLQTRQLPSGHGGLESAFGLLTCLPYVWLAVTLPAALRRLPREIRTIAGYLPAAAALVGLASVLILGCFCGVCLRYSSEFAPTLILAAAVAALAWDQSLGTRGTARRWFHAASAVLLVYGLTFTTLHGHSLRELTLSRMLNDFGLFLAAQPERREESILSFQQALKHTPRSAVIRLNLGLRLAESGRLDAALEQFEAALQLDPNFTPARQVLQQLRPAAPP
jgi:hypothetical protein